jgi:MFS family permease
MSAATVSPAMPWYRTITREQWLALAAAKVGWMLDAMDFTLYVVALNQLRNYFGFDDAMAGLLGTVALVMSGVGGLTFGYVADRFGRTRALMGTIALFSIASLGAATSQTVIQLMLWRALLGLGMGGEWASGAVLVSETWPPEHRNKAISIMQSGWALGYLLALLSAQVILGSAPFGPDSWRLLFTLGILPAIFALWIRRYVKEPEKWTRDARPRRQAESIPRDFRPGADPAHGADHPPRRLRAVWILGSVHLAARIPRTAGLGRWRRTGCRPVARMADPGSARGVRGLPDVRIHADRLGRRPAFVLFMVGAAVLAPVYGQYARSPIVLMLAGPLLGYFASGHFSMFGSFVAELFPTRIRATGQGTSYNIGRMAGAIAPYTMARSPPFQESASASRWGHVSLLPARRCTGFHAARSEWAGAGLVVRIVMVVRIVENFQSA